MLRKTRAYKMSFLLFILGSYMKSYHCSLHQVNITHIVRLQSTDFQKFGLVKDMLETIDIVRQFDCGRLPRQMRAAARNSGKLFFAGEGGFLFLFCF